MTEQQHTTFPFYMATLVPESPYYQRTVEAGCTSWDLYNHMLIPTLYDDDLKEYWHLLNTSRSGTWRSNDRSRSAARTRLASRSC